MGTFEFCLGWAFLDRLMSCTLGNNHIEDIASPRRCFLLAEDATVIATDCGEKDVTQRYLRLIVGLQRLF